MKNETANPTAEKENVTAVESKNASIQEVVNGAIKKNPDGGSVTLNSLEKQFKNLSRHDIVEQSRNLSGGAKFVVGRKGGDSRIVWGSEIPKHMTNAPKRPYYRNRIQKERKQEETAESSTGFNYEFKIQVGNEVKTLPISIQLEKVAA